MLNFLCISPDESDGVIIFKYVYQQNGVSTFSVDRTSHFLSGRNPVHIVEINQISVFTLCIFLDLND